MTVTKFSKILLSFLKWFISRCLNISNLRVWWFCLVLNIKLIYKNNLISLTQWFILDYSALEVGPDEQIHDIPPSLGLSGHWACPKTEAANTPQPQFALHFLPLLPQVPDSTETLSRANGCKRTAFSWEVRMYLFIVQGQSYWWS